MQVGEHWVYREKANAIGTSIRPVEIVRHGPTRSAKVQVRWLDGEFPGLEDWVPRGRLKVPWHDKDAWQADEIRNRALAVASGCRDHEWHALELVLLGTPFGELAHFGSARNTAWLESTNLGALAAALGLDEQPLMDAEGAFVDRHGLYHAPWPTTRNLLERACHVWTEDVIRLIGQTEREIVTRARTGRYLGRRNGYWVPPEQCVEDNDTAQAMVDMLRTWCGQPATERFDELRALREEVRRVGGIAEQALTQLRRHGHTRDADKLTKQLGIPADAVKPVHR